MITDGSRYATPQDAGDWTPKTARVPESLSDNFQVTKSLAQPSVNELIGAPAHPVDVITMDVDTQVPATGQVFPWENTPNRYSNGIQIQTGSQSAKVYISVSSTEAVLKDQALVAAGQPPVNALWTQLAPVNADALTSGQQFFVDGQVRGIWVDSATRVAILSR